MRASDPVRSVEHDAARLPTERAGIVPSARGLTASQDVALTAMLVLLCALLFIATPLAGLDLGASRLLISLLVMVYGLLVILIARGRTAALVAWSGAGSTAFGTLLVIVEPVHSTFVAVHIVNIIGIILSGYVIARALFAPGPITLHRVIGAVVLYLTIGLAFAMIYRLVCDIIPDALQGTASGAGEIKLFNSVIYFSLVTLTSTGYGDIIPIHPIARSLANLEAIIGQMYPVTLVAALVTQHLEWRRL